MDKENELAKRYISGDLTETQLNYLAFQEGVDKRKLRKTIKQIQLTEPYAVVVKLMLGYIFFNFIFCFFYSLIIHFKK